MKIAFIGLGIMGSRMAGNLITAGYDLVVFNRTKDKAESLLTRGATWGSSPAETAKQAEILITMLATPEAVQQNALGHQGFLDHLQPRSIWVDCSTVNPSFSKKMASAAHQRKIRHIDAPVLGTKKPAQEGTLTFFVGGEQTDIEAIRPLL
jgi:3-hydroxyisobutyrate dehydrogenase-like beta-hydroxyacid dehydrogenase